MTIRSREERIQINRKIEAIIEDRKQKLKKY
jgi:hypothetical protein